jgi:hypothetical protein
VTAQVARTSPVLSLAVAVSPPATMLKVEGEGFTPDGLVQLVIYDRWGVDGYDHVWTIAAHGHYGVSGSDDPDLGYVAPGDIDVVIELVPAVVYVSNGSLGSDLGDVPGANQPIPDYACARDLMVRAYDQQAGTWSNLLDVTALC